MSTPKQQSSIGYCLLVTPSFLKKNYLEKFLEGLPEEVLKTKNQTIEGYKIDHTSVALCDADDMEFSKQEIEDLKRKIFNVLSGKDFKLEIYEFGVKVLWQHEYQKR